LYSYSFSGFQPQRFIDSFNYILRRPYFVTLSSLSSSEWDFVRIKLSSLSVLGYFWNGYSGVEEEVASRLDWWLLTVRKVLNLLRYENLGDTEDSFLRRAKCKIVPFSILFLIIKLSAKNGKDYFILSIKNYPINREMSHKSVYQIGLRCIYGILWLQRLKITGYCYLVKVYWY